MLDSSGLHELRKGTNFSNKDFVQSLLQQNRELEAALLQEEQADLEKFKMIKTLEQ